MVARLELIDLRANFLNNSCGFVAEDGGRWELVEAVDEVQVTMANAARSNAHDDFVIDGFVDIDLLGGQRLMRSMKKSGLHASTSR